MRDVNGFNIYNFNGRPTEGRTVQRSQRHRVHYLWKPHPCKSEGWLPEGREGLDVSNLFGPKNKVQMVALLEYINLHNGSIENMTFSQFLKKTHGQVIPNTGVIRTIPSDQSSRDGHECRNASDYNACGLISFFGEDVLREGCVCQFRDLLHSLVGRNRDPQLTHGLNRGETLSEDHLDMLGKYYNKRVMIVQSVRSQLFVLDLGNTFSPDVKFIHSNGVHFEEFVYRSD